MILNPEIFCRNKYLLGLFHGTTCENITAIKAELNI